jgi:hypothetical protein
LPPPTGHARFSFAILLGIDLPGTLAHWRKDADLAGIRDDEPLARLPDAERQQWQALWGDVRQLLADVQGKMP